MPADVALAPFPHMPGWCNTATFGIPPPAAVTALRAGTEAWATGTMDPVAHDADVRRARTTFAAITGTTMDRVAMPGAVSITSGLVASSLPDGARVLLAREDFTSVLYPFLVEDRLDVQFVQLEGLVDAIRPGIDLVAASAVQSADGRLLDLDALAVAAADAGARTYVDFTQSAGWLPLQADRFDVTACAAYKWLCSPRGIGFMTVRADVDWLVPRLAGWYSTDSPWDTCYGPPLQLASDAHRFSVSPPWADVRAAAAALEAIATLGVDVVNRHDVGLANRFRAALDLPPASSAIVALETAPSAATALTEAGITTATRAGRTRLSFHTCNDTSDADAAADALRDHLAA